LTTSSPDATPKQVLRLIPDAIRFTYCFQPENYTRGYFDIKEQFESRGHEMYYSKNYWTDPEYSTFVFLPCAVSLPGVAMSVVSSRFWGRRRG
jgi:hypothetical protein